MMNIRKNPTEKEMLEKLKKGKVSLPPLSFSLLEQWKSPGHDFDALVAGKWKGKKIKFALEYKSLSTPKAFRDGLNQLRALKSKLNYKPLLCLPYLSDKQLEELEQEEISGIDLCGNGVFMVPEILSVFRSGARNRYSTSAPIKNIYRKNTSMVGRTFLGLPIFESVQEILSEIKKRNLMVNRWGKRPMSLSTVSKSLKTLEADLIINRNGEIRLLQADKLLEKLNQNYEAPKINKKMKIKITNDTQDLRQLLVSKSRNLSIPLVATGLSSVKRFALMQREDILSIYCPRTDDLLEQLSGNQSDRFPNLQIIETEEETVYFDAREEDGFWWASPVQVYLELMAGDKRDQETAAQVRAYILNKTKDIG